MIVNCYQKNKKLCNQGFIGVHLTLIGLFYFSGGVINLISDFDLHAMFGV
jgi:hypothetical protein